jgi:hypothetical protein
MHGIMENDCTEKKSWNWAKSVSKTSGRNDWEQVAGAEGLLQMRARQSP